MPQRVNRGFHIEGHGVNIDVVVSDIEDKGTNSAYFTFDVRGDPGYNGARGEELWQINSWHDVRLQRGNSLMLTNEIELVHSEYNGKGKTPVYIEFHTKKRYQIQPIKTI